MLLDESLETASRIHGLLHARQAQQVTGRGGGAVCSVAESKWCSFVVWCTLCSYQLRLLAAVSDDVLQPSALLLLLLLLMMMIWLLCDFYFFMCAYIVAKLYVGTCSWDTIYAPTKSINHTKVKFAAIVQVVCGTMCRKFCSKRTTFDKVIVKKLKISMDTSMAAVSPYFKRSMIGSQICGIKMGTVGYLHGDRWDEISGDSWQWGRPQYSPCIRWSCIASRRLSLVDAA